MFEPAQQDSTNTTAATSVEHAEQRKNSNNNLRGGAASGSSPHPILSSNERISATDINRDEFHIRERYLSRPSPQNTV